MIEMNKPVDYLDTKIYWLSCPKFTIMVPVRFFNGDWCVDGLDKDAAPLIRKRFDGQPWLNLVNWAKSIGETKIVEIDNWTPHDSSN